MSSRWSYGPEGLRERPARPWSEAELWPRWRELQPLLMRSAGVVGIAATILAVVSSDALRLGGDVAPVGRNDRAEYPAAKGVQPVQAIVAAASEMHAGTVAAPPSEPPPARIAALDVQGPPAAASEAAASAGAPAAAAPLADLRRDGIPPPPDSPAPITTASVSAADGVAAAAPPVLATRGIPEAAAAVESVADSVTHPAAAEPAVWSDGATCPRDWVAADPAADTSAAPAGCTTTAEFVASTQVGAKSALEEAAAARAESLAMLLPRIPAPRPDAVPVVKPARVARASSGRPLGPPPNCGAGHHAKWHYVDRKVGTKEWYCR